MDVKDNTTMAIWIVSETTIGRNVKFIRLARTLNIHVGEAVGCIHFLWHNVLEMKEDGDISSWTDDDIEFYSQWEGDKGKFAKALYKDEHRFIDKDKSSILIHDWLQTAGRYLIKRYGTANREKLVEIWNKHGMVYGQSQQDEHPTKPKRAKLEKKFLDDSTEVKASEYLFSKIKGNYPNAREPNYQKWAVDMHGLIIIDKCPKEQVRKVIDWAMQHSGNENFPGWKTVILSPKKLRKHYPTLLLQMENKKGGKTVKSDKPMERKQNLCIDCRKPTPEIRRNSM